MLIRGARTAAATAAILLSTASCGISPEHSARTIPVPNIATRTPHGAVESTGPVNEKLFLVKDGELAETTRQVHDTPTVASLAADLLAGPTSTERDAGYTSALLGTNLIGTVTRQGSQAIVELTADDSDQVRNDQVLGFAQIVCTLTGLPNVTAVGFQYSGQPVAVPRADGSLSDNPLSAADYQGLATKDS